MTIKEQVFAVHWAASGILPVARDTARICLARRSRWVQCGNCWGTIGGAVQTGLSLQGNALCELREETGYCGEIELYPAYVFRRGVFEYHNFIGLVPAEFAFVPDPANLWETDYIEWFDLTRLLHIMETSSADFHFGVLKLFENSGELIARLANPALDVCRQPTSG